MHQVPLSPELPEKTTTLKRSLGLHLRVFDGCVILIVVSKGSRHSGLGPDNPLGREGVGDP